MPGGNKEHQALALYHFDINVHLLESSQHDKLLSFLISVVCTLADSELIPSTTQPIPMWSHWKMNTLSHEDSYPKKKNGLFAAAKVFGILAQVEFQLKK